MKVSLSVKGVQDAIDALNRYSDWLEERAKELCMRLASLGAVRATLEYSRVAYVGNKDFNVTVEPTDNGYKVLADGETVLFLEFGAGVTYGYGHPQAGQFGMGPGTYNPESDNWKNPNGWWIPGHQHTYGNPPAMGMYYAAESMRRNIEEVAREVFAHD